MTPAELDTESPFGARRAGTGDRLGWRVATFRWPPRLKRWLRRRVRHRRGPFDVAVPAAGVDAMLRFRAYPSENYCDRVLVGRQALPERAEHAAIGRLQRERPIGVFVDVGANVGTYSCFVAAVAPEARILAFEPHPRTAAKLRFNLAANGAVHARVVEAAVGEGPGRLPLWSDGGGNVGQTSLLPEATSNARHAVSVAVVALADILAESEIQHIDLLKIDVEGFEDRALSPFLATAPRALRPRAILLEEEHSHLWRDPLLDRMRRLGYREHFRTAQNALYVLDA